MRMALSGMMRFRLNEFPLPSGKRIVKFFKCKMYR